MDNLIIKSKQNIFFDIEKNNNINNIIAYFSFNNKGINIEYTKKTANIWSIIDKVGGLMYVIVTITKIINNFISRKILCIDLYENLGIKESPRKTNYLNSRFHENTNSRLSIDNLRNNNLAINNTKEHNYYDFSNENFKNYNTVLFKLNRLDIKKNAENNKGNQESNFKSLILKYNVRSIGNNLINNQKIKKKEIIKKHLYLFYICPNCIIEKTKTFDHLSKIRKNVLQYYSIENFIKVVKLEKNIKNNPTRYSSYIKNSMI